MKLLVVDNTKESQAFCARRIEQFTQSDMEMLDLKVKLANERDCMERVSEADVLVIGSGLGERATNLARSAMGQVPWLHIIMFVSDEAYGGGAFRAAHSVGVRKVFPDSASPLDFLQELIAINTEFRKEGRTREGKVVAITHAKGGVGATSLAAGLAEVCSVFHRKTMLWDLDIETRDLSRALTVSGVEAKVVSAWVTRERDISRESLKDALIPISTEVSVLMPPDKMNAALDLVCSMEGVEIAQRVLELSRVLFDTVIIDTGGRLGPSTGAILRLADVIVIVLDDSVLGLTAVDLFLSFVKNLAGSTDKIVFAVTPHSGGMASISELASALEPAHKLGDAPWRLPPIPNDPKAAHWPGSGRTLYSMGQKHTRAALERICHELGLIKSLEPHAEPAPQAGGSSWIGKFFKK